MGKSTSPSKPANQEPSSSSDLLFVARTLGRLFLLGALGIALYLGIQSLRNGGIAGCDDGGGCHQVIASKWGYLFGIPVSLLGAATYLALLGSDLKGCCSQIHALCRWMILGAAVWFVCVQAFIIHQFCPWCCVTHLLAVLGCALLWRRSSGNTLPLIGAATAALAGVALLQAFGPDRPTVAGGSLAEGEGAQVSAPQEQGPRTVSLHSGKFTIEVDDFPSIGDSKTADHVAVGIFDFTCPHCRELTEILTNMHDEFGGKLAVVQLPGHFAAKGEAIHRMLLPIWKEDPETYHQLADLLHEGTLQAAEADVRNAIGSMVEPATHRAWVAKHDPWSMEVLANSQAIRAANKEKIKTGKFPQLMVGDYIEAGSNDNPGHYYDLFKEHFGLSRATIPKLDISPATIDLGDIYVGAPTEFSIQLTNPGKIDVKMGRPQLLRGMRMKAGQGLPKVLRAGQSATLTLTATPPGPGAMNGHVGIVSDAEPALLRVPISAKAIEAYTLTPRTLDLGEYQGEPLSGKVTISLKAPATLSVPRPNNPNEFEVSLTEVEPQLVYDMEITAKPNTKRTGLHQTSVSVSLQPTTPNEAFPKLLRVYARCRVPRPEAPPAQAPPAPRPLPNKGN